MMRNELAHIGIPLFSIALIEIILGTLLLLHNPRNRRVHKSVATFSFFTAAFSLFTALMYLLASFGRDITFLARASWIGWLMIPAGLQFIYYMQDENSKSARIAGYVLYPFWIIVLCISISSNLIESGNYTLLPYIDRSGPLNKPLRIVGVLQLLWVIFEIYRLRKKVSGIRRAQLNFFMNGLLIFIVGGTIVAGIFPLFGVGFEPGLSSYFSLPWVALTFYAMTRYRLFDIRSVISRFAAVALLSAVFAVIQIGLFKLLEPVLGASLTIAVSLFLMGFLFFSTTFNQKVNKKIQDLVLHHKLDYQQVLKESINAIITILDLHQLLNYLINSIKSGLGVGNVCLFLREKDGHYRHPPNIGEWPEQPEERLVGEPVLDWIKQHRDVVIREELEEKLSEEQFGRLNAWMRKAKTEVIIPLFYKGDLQGVLTLGAKGNGDLYTQSDIDLLEALAGHAAVAIENARLYNEVRQAKESLQESEGKFRTLAQTLPAAIFIHREGNILYANPSAETITGYTTKEFLAMDFQTIVHPEFRKMTAIRGNTPLHEERPAQAEFKIIRKDGAERWVLMTAARLDYEERPAVIGTLLDITERKALEGQLRYSQKMEAIGKLAGGVAHDFNNVLTAIVGYGNVLHMKLAKDDPLRVQVDQILAATERAASMTQTLLAFGKKQVVSLRSEDLNNIVQRMEKLLTGLLRKGIELSTHYSGHALPVQADSSQIERIIMNLLVNARDAMPDGGIVTLETGRAELDNEFVKTYGYGKAGLYAVVSLSDTGIGMDAAIKGKIFEPFFTTKGLEKGTGFGLSIVYDIVKEHRGYVTVDSEPGKGTTFRVYLPFAKELAEAKPLSAPAPVRGTETILVAENENDVRELMKAVLEGYGYTVIEAVDGADAVAKFTKHKDIIQLLILDVIMPRMNGIEAYAAIRKKQRKVKALFTSGYSEDLIQNREMLDKGQRFIVKPFLSKDLVARVREALDNEPL